MSDLEGLVNELEHDNTEHSNFTLYTGLALLPVIIILLWLAYSGTFGLYGTMECAVSGIFGAVLVTYSLGKWGYIKWIMRT